MYFIPYMMIFLQNMINKQWISFAAPEKMEVRSLLSKFLLSHHDRVPNFIRNKLVKLVVDIGRLDWPHFYPDFFTSIIHVCASAKRTFYKISYHLDTCSKKPERNILDVC